MKKSYIIIVLLLILPRYVLSQKNVSNIKLFYLGGQSNMNGYGKIEELPKALNKQFKNIYIYHGNSTADEQIEGSGNGIWRNLQKGHGSGFKSDGKKNYYSEKFGVELSFAKRISELYPDEKIAIIKYSRGGTSIDSRAEGKYGSWDFFFKGKTGINQYDHFLNTVKNAVKVKDIDGDGLNDNLIPSGIVWMQGESDATFTEEVAKDYYDNLKILMALMRAAFRNDNIPVVIGKISDSGKNEMGKVWEHGELVQYAQEKYVKLDPNAIIIRETNKYNYSDKAHYDSKGYIDLGVKFADAIYKLNSSEK